MEPGTKGFELPNLPLTTTYPGLITCCLKVANFPTCMCILANLCFPNLCVFLLNIVHTYVLMIAQPIKKLKWIFLSKCQIAHNIPLLNKSRNQDLKKYILLI